MKKTLLIFIIVSILIVGFASIAYASSHVFYLVNYTGVDIYAVYVSPSNSSNWGGNVIGGVLYNGYQVPIALYGYNSYWDLMIEDRDGNRVYWRNIQLNNINRYTLYP